MSFINIIKTDENARLIFGKRELKIIEKQLLGINLTQSEKNRLSRDIRKKFEFIKEIAGFKNLFKLKKASEIKRLIEDAKGVILEHPLKKNIKKILLFGSAVTNELTFRSDIDIAVVFNKIDKKEATKFRVHVAGRSSDRIDIQVFNVLPNKIKKEIEKHNKVLYKK